MLIFSLDLGKYSTVCGFHHTSSRKHRFETVATQRDYLQKLFSLEKRESEQSNAEKLLR